MFRHSRRRSGDPFLRVIRLNRCRNRSGGQEVRRGHGHRTDGRGLGVLMLRGRGIVELPQGGCQEGIETLTQPRSIARAGHDGLAGPGGRRRSLLNRQARVRR